MTRNENLDRLMTLPTVGGGLTTFRLSEIKAINTIENRCIVELRNGMSYGITPEGANELGEAMLVIQRAEERKQHG